MSSHIKFQLKRPAISGAWSNPHNSARIAREANAYIEQLESSLQRAEARIQELEARIKSLNLPRESKGDFLAGIKDDHLSSLSGMLENAFTLTSFDLEEILEKHGIKVRRDFNYDNMGYASISHVKNGDIEIWLNLIDSDIRQKYALAYAIGHIGLNVDLSIDGNREFAHEPAHFRGRRSRASERVANEFAINLLLPEELVRSEAAKLLDEYQEAGSVRGATDEDEICKILAQKFGVSADHMEARIIALDALKPAPRPEGDMDFSM